MADPAFQGDANNRTCQFCQQHEASHFCKCTGSPTLFCLDCCGQHNAKYPRAIHQAIPIAALSQNPEEYMRKYEALTKAATELRSNVERMEQCSRDFAKMMQNCINYVTEYRDWWLQQLQTEKEALAVAIETAIQEATSSLDQGVEPVSALAQAMWVLPTEELHVFEYTVSAPDLSTLCTNWAHYHLKSVSEGFAPAPEEPPPNLFAAICMQSMELYDFNTHKATQHQLPTCIWSGYIQVDRITVLIVGKQVMTLDLLTLQITPLASLSTPRNFVGVAQVDNTVFAFGGSGSDYSPSVLCEKGSVLPTRWTPLPPMHYARSCFTPCFFKSLLYLVSTWAKEVESFSPHTETFTVLSVSLPAQIQLNSPSVAFVANGELVLQTSRKQMARWKIGCEAHFRVSALDRGCCSYHPPLIVGTEVYIANEAKVGKWSLETERFV